MSIKKRGRTSYKQDIIDKIEDLNLDLQEIKKYARTYPHHGEFSKLNKITKEAELKDTRGLDYHVESYGFIDLENKDDLEKLSRGLLEHIAQEAKKEKGPINNDKRMKLDKVSSDGISNDGTSDGILSVYTQKYGGKSRRRRRKTNKKKTRKAKKKTHKKKRKGNKKRKTRSRTRRKH